VIVRLDVELHPLDREFREGVLAGKPHCADRETASSTRGEDPVRHLGDAVIAEPDLAAADGLAAVRVAGGKRPRAAAAAPLSLPAQNHSSHALLSRVRRIPTEAASMLLVLSGEL
jgi:hypothetical protein